MSSIPNLLAVLRALNISLGRLSVYTVINVKTLKSYVDGTVKPRKETIAKIAKALYVSKDDLMRNDYVGKEMAMLSAVENRAAEIRRLRVAILANILEQC